MSFQAVTDFEKAIAKYFGAPHAVAVDCCTHAIELCLRHKKIKKMQVPTHTYLSVAFLGDKLGIDWDWKEEDWQDYYYLGGGALERRFLYTKHIYVSEFSVSKTSKPWAWRDNING